MREFDELATLIDNSKQVLSVFFRDDDAGWANERLIALCERFGACGVSLDLAVIPDAMHGDAQETLYGLLQQHGTMLRLHQHGYTHVNHQQSGRKCEFGSDRSLGNQQSDIAAGQNRLRALFGHLIAPIFTPPWNRCTGNCSRALAELDFEVLSRIGGSAALDHCGLQDVSVTIDWQKKRAGVRRAGPDFDHYAAAQCKDLQTVGIMLHHAMMDAADLAHFTCFLEFLQDSPNVRLRTIMDIAADTLPETPYREIACN